MTIQLAETETDIRRCFPIMVQLRRHLDEESFVRRVHDQHEQSGYRLAYVEAAGAIKAVAGFRIMETLFAPRHMYVDDLVTDEAERSKGHGDALFDWLAARARAEGCEELHLDSGTHRHAAHRFYFRKGMYIASYHFRVSIE